LSDRESTSSSAITACRSGRSCVLAARIRWHAAEAPNRGDCAVQNKVGHFVSSPLLRNIVGQPVNRLNLRRVLDDGKILLVNLSKGRLGDDASGLLGSLLVTALQLAAMSRADVPEQERRPFYLYVDEFQNFATESFATILSEARKYRLSRKSPTRHTEVSSIRLVFRSRRPPLEEEE